MPKSYVEMCLCVFIERIRLICNVKLFGNWAINKILKYASVFNRRCNWLTRRKLRKLFGSELRKWHRLTPHCIQTNRSHMTESKRIFRNIFFTLSIFANNFTRQLSFLSLSLFFDSFAHLHMHYIPQTATDFFIINSFIEQMNLMFVWELCIFLFFMLLLLSISFNTHKTCKNAQNNGT